MTMTAVDQQTMLSRQMNTACQLYQWLTFDNIIVEQKLIRYKNARKCSSRKVPFIWLVELYAERLISTSFCIARRHFSQVGADIC